MFELPKLDYDYDALGENISKDIMILHHTKHHQTYVDKLNQAIENHPELKSYSIEKLLTEVNSLDEAVRPAIRNHGGGHYNHSMFWKCMSPSGGGEPTGALYDSLVAKYGSIQDFKDEFTSKSLAVFGSGWAWLMPDMEIITTANQDNPMMDGMPAPILGLDVWEHAYYLDYANKRDDYVAAWWHVVDWRYVSTRLSDTSLS